MSAKLVYSKLSGGLGNQMFQFAMGYALAKRNNCLQKLDISTLISTNTKDITERNFELGVFDLQVGFLSAAEREKKFQKSNGFLARHFGFSKLYQVSENGFRYNPAYSQTKLPVYLEGYFQSEKYFLDFAGEIRSKFLRNALFLKEDVWFKKIFSTEIPVSIHIRRGDYISNIETQKYHGICKATYYEEAVNYILEKYPLAQFFVFSDDILLAAKEIGHISANFHFVKYNEPRIAAHDMLLMSQCEHNIIANSSYSWWGAWLSENPDKIVIAPKQWFANEEMNAQTGDLIPENWIRM